MYLLSGDFGVIKNPCGRYVTAYCNYSVALLQLAEALQYSHLRSDEEIETNNFSQLK